MIDLSNTSSEMIANSFDTWTTEEIEICVLITEMTYKNLMKWELFSPSPTKKKKVKKGIEPSAYATMLLFSSLTLADTISLAQGASVKSRHILDVVLVLNEVVEGYKGSEIWQRGYLL